MLFLISILLVMFASFFYLSVFEWALHRYIMHRPLAGITYPFVTHALTHHRIFRADFSYHLLDMKDKNKIPMAWWCGPVLVTATTLPSVPVSLFFGAWWITFGVFLASAMYFSAYEYMHWCMHLPKERWLDGTRFFFRLNGHHLLHHSRPSCNFNVVFPFADLIFGTLVRRAEFKFVQVRGKSVPDVQPV